MNAQSDGSFRFYSRQSLIYLTGKKARNLSELLAGIAEAKESSIFHHTHHFLVYHDLLSPEPPNDFAYWIAHALQNRVLGEEVASIDLRACTNLESIRSNIIRVIKRVTGENTTRIDRNVQAGEEFHFMESQSFVFPTQYVAHSLAEFRRCLEEVSIQSIYFHVFEARLRHRDSEFSTWLTSSLKEDTLAIAFLHFDPYTQTLDNLRRTLIRLVDERLE
jgi:hypothetical protein